MTQGKSEDFYRDCPVKPDNDTRLRNSRIPKVNKKRLGILDFRILEFLAQSYVRLASAMMLDY